MWSRWSRVRSATTEDLPQVRPPASLGGTIEAITEVLVTWPLVNEAADYEVRWRVANGSWTTATNLSSQQGIGQWDKSELTWRNTTYEFKCAPKVMGLTDSAECGRWSISRLATTGPPPEPTGLAVRSKTETSVKLEYHTVMGATYEVDPERVGGGTRDVRNDEAPGSTSGLAIHTVTGLESGTEYSFRVRATGDGSRWTNEASESVLMVRTAGTAPVSYAAPSTHDIGSGHDECYNTLGRVYVHEHAGADTTPEQTTTLGSTTHVAKADFYFMPILPDRTVPIVSSYCWKGRVTNESTPGAMESEWSGAIHEGEYRWVNFDVTQLARAILGQTTGPVVAFRQYHSPARTDTPLFPRVDRSCAAPCEGGWTDLQRVQSVPAVLRHKTYYVFGGHSFTHVGSPWETTTDNKASTPARWPVLSLGWVGAVLGEIAQDLAEEPMQLLRDKVDELRGEDDD